MDVRVASFKNCDARFQVYLEKVLSRLPQGVRESILNNEAFQVLADCELPDVCGRLLSFDQPVEYLVYLNPKTLAQPDNRLLCSIAWELAEYVLKMEGKESNEKEVEQLLVQWGFEQEVDCVRYCDAVSRSPAFKSGYEWARKQKKEYLMLHFGLYFDEWNERGLRRMSKERLDMIRAQTAHSKVLPGARANEPKRQNVAGISEEEAAMEGIMVAVKEAKMTGK